MKRYNRILACVDVSGEEFQVMDQASGIAEEFSATLSVAHVIKPISYFYGGDMSFNASEIQEQIQQMASMKMDALAQKYSIVASQVHVVAGSPAREIHRLAQEGNVDLVVIGTHGRQGLSLLLGSTATSVLHGALCDVLTVKIH